MQLVQTQWCFFISCKGLCTQIVQTKPEFQFTTTIVVSMANKSNDLDDQISGTNLQNDGHTPHIIKWPKRPWRDGSIWQCPLPFSISVPREVTIPWSPQDPILSGNMCNFNQEERSCTSSIPHLDGTSGGGHATMKQRWPHWSSSDGPRKGYPVLWEAFPRRRPELRWGERHHIYTYRCGYLGW